MEYYRKAFSFERMRSFHAPRSYIRRAASSTPVQIAPHFVHVLPVPGHVRRLRDTLPAAVAHHLQSGRPVRSDPEPLRALMPSCYELACYEGTTVSWSSLDFLRDAAHLDVLSLPFDGKIAADLSALSSVPSLRILRLSDVPVSEKILAEIGRMEKLEILWLPGCGITDVSPLAGLKNLEELNLQNNEIRDDPEPNTK